MVELGLLSTVTILGMAVVTYLTRIGGFWAFGKFSISPPVQAWLEYIPVTILIALTAPEVVRGGLPEWGAALSALLVAYRTGTILYAMIAGVAVVFSLRRLQIPF